MDQKHGMGKLFLALTQTRDGTVTSMSGEGIAELKYLQGTWDRDRCVGYGRAMTRDGTELVGSVRDGPGGISFIPETTRTLLEPPPTSVTGTECCLP